MARGGSRPGSDDQIADSVANGLASDQSTRTTWLKAVDRWDSQLVTPFLTRVHSRLGITVEPDTALRHRLGRILASRVTEVRFGAEGEEEFLLQNDPDIRAALTYLPRLPKLLKGP